MQQITTYVLSSLDAISPPINEDKLVELVNTLHKEHRNEEHLQSFLESFTLITAGILIDYREKVIRNYRLAAYTRHVILWADWLKSKDETDQWTTLNKKLKETFGTSLDGLGEWKQNHFRENL